MQTGHPIWRILNHQGRTLSWLAERTGYSPAFVRGMKIGQWPISEAFRQKAAVALDLPIDVLFLSASPEPAEVA